MAIRILFLSVCFAFAFGFLLDDKTTPSVLQQSSGLSDEHYHAIMTFIDIERKERLNLERRVEHLENELQSAEKGVTDVYHQNQDSNRTIIDLKNMVSKLTSENALLKMSNNDFKLELIQLTANNTGIQNELVSLRQDIANLQQLKGVQNLQTILDIQNETIRLDKVITDANNRMNSMAVDIEARKQDFLALYNMATATEKSLERTEASFNYTLSATILGQNHSLTHLGDKLSTFQNFTTGKLNDINNRTLNTDEKLGKIEKSFNETLSSTMKQQNQSLIELEHRLNILNHNQSETAAKLDSEVRHISGRACVRSTKTYSGSEKVLFDDIRTKSSIRNDVITEFTKTGIFRVSHWQSGIYHISVYITTSTKGYVHFNVMRNGAVIGYGFTSIENNYQTTSVVLAEQLNASDTLYIQTRGGISVTYNRQSCISLLQLTG